MWSKYGHCGVLHEDGVIEASAFKGVVVTPYDEFLTASTRYEVINIPAKDPEAVIAKMLTQVGKPYDWGGIFGIILRQRNWHDEGSWTCSELVAWAFEEAGQVLFRINSWRVKPQDIYLPIFKE